MLQQFVRVRLVQANSLDLGLFQFDFDLTFAAFFMNADRTVYGRYGSRSATAEESSKDISLESFRAALAGALELHRKHNPKKISPLLAGKQSAGARFAKPEDYPALQGKYRSRLDYEGKVAQSCIHCHQVHESERLFFRSQNQPIPSEVLYPWPMPDAVGLALDPQKKATVLRVVKDSFADRAGFKAGDELTTFDGQTILSIADVQWVLHRAKGEAAMRAVVRRGTRSVTLMLKLSPDWRRASDISWRASTWDLRRMALGGIWFEEVSDGDRAQHNLKSSELALRARHVGEYGAHAAAKRAGVKKGDILVEIDGRAQRRTESQIVGDLLQNRMPGAKISATFLRDGQRMTFELPMQ